MDLYSSTGPKSSHCFQGKSSSNSSSAACSALPQGPATFTSRPSPNPGTNRLSPPGRASEEQEWKRWLFTQRGRSSGASKSWPVQLVQDPRDVLPPSLLPRRLAHRTFSSVPERNSHHALPQKDALQHSVCYGPLQFPQILKRENLFFRKQSNLADVKGQEQQ